MNKNTVKPEAQHTPTPWRVTPLFDNATGHPQWEIAGDGVCIAKLTGKFASKEWNDEERANAAFIVRAVNAHEKLLQVAYLFKGGLRLIKEGKPLPIFWLMKEVDQAIAKAEGR